MEELSKIDPRQAEPDEEVINFLFDQEEGELNSGDEEDATAVQDGFKLVAGPNQQLFLERVLHLAHRRCLSRQASEH